MIAKLQEEVVQGPLDHGVHGQSVVIRPTVDTGRVDHYPTQAVVVTTAASLLIGLSKAGEKLKCIVVEGDRDPTSHPEFNDITDNLRDLCRKWFPKSSLRLIADQPDLARPEVRLCLSAYDKPILRFEAGTQKTFAALSGRKAKQFKGLVEGLKRLELERLIINATFVRGTVDNSTEAEVKAWVRHLESIRPASVQISTPKGTRKGIKPVTAKRMQAIADLVTEKTGVPVEIVDA